MGNHHGDWWEAKEISHREWLGGYESSEIIITSTILKEEIKQIYKIPDYKLWEIRILFKLSGYLSLQFSLNELFSLMS